MEEWASNTELHCGAINVYPMMSRKPIQPEKLEGQYHVPYIFNIMKLWAI